MELTFSEAFEQYGPKLKDFVSRLLQRDVDNRPDAV
jgi:DNA-directed RNA polymerase specialized sigma24 family protein